MQPQSATLYYISYTMHIRDIVRVNSFNSFSFSALTIDQRNIPKQHTYIQ